jgi:4-amino-4-deoxy-L-arabinose transferase-like glycosyltransferase
MPISPNWDEVSHGYNAYSILKTGMDEWGKSFPLIFRAFGDYKLPLYIYLTVFPVAVFGLNVFAVRFISALAGTLAIPGIYLLTNLLWPDKNISLKKVRLNIGLLAAIFLTICPWHYFISRPALEANLSLTLVIFGFYFLLKGFQKSLYLMPSSILLGMSLHTYNTARVFVPIMLLFTLILYRKKITINRFSFGASIIFVGFVVIVISQIFSGEATARYSKLQILSDNKIFQIGENLKNSKLPTVIAKLFHNRPVYFIETATTNYLGYFSPQFIYQSVGAQDQFAIPNQNLITLPVSILFLIGVIYIFFNLKHLSNLFILAWLIFSPVAASLTIDPPQALRPTPMIPALICIAVLGLSVLINKVSGMTKVFILIVVISASIFSFGKYLVNYYGDYANSYSSSWQYGYQETVNFVDQEQTKYEKIFISKVYGEPHIFYAFFSKLDPKMIQLGGDNIRYKKSDWYWTDKIGKIYFVNDWEIPVGTSAAVLHLESGEYIPTKNSLLITSPLRVPGNAKLIKTINNPSGNPVFIISKIE